MEFEHKLVDFECNVCEAQNRLSTHEFSREGGLCSNCNSNVRLRSIIHLLSISIFGESFSLPKFPVRRNLAGIGMSDWEVYAKKLKTKLERRELKLKIVLNNSVKSILKLLKIV